MGLVAMLVLAVLGVGSAHGWTYMLSPDGGGDPGVAADDVNVRCGPWMCKWDKWSAWSECKARDASCRYGFMMRSRKALVPDQCPTLRCRGTSLSRKSCRPTCKPTSKACGENQVYNDCGSGCGDYKCGDDLGPRVCPAVCKRGCFCRRGYVRDDKNNCVKPSQCSTVPEEPRCGTDETWSMCSGHCDTKCTDRGRTICTTQCSPGCICRPGYARDDRGRCIPKSRCRVTPSCDTNEVFRSCGSSCGDPRCVTSQQPRRCNKKCRAACFCRPGYVRDDRNKCIRRDQCSQTPKKSCPTNEIFKECKGCDKKCGDPQFKICTLSCRAGCACKTGYSRHTSLRCIRTSQCPRTQRPTCKANELYRTCGSGCGDPKCGDQQGQRRICPTVCKQGCMCRRGYVRNPAGECVRPSQCEAPTKPSCTGRFEKYDECGSGCGDPKCSDINREKKFERQCTADCKPGCFCLKNFARNYAGVCVPRFYCAATGQREKRKFVSPRK